MNIFTKVFLLFLTCFFALSCENPENDSVIDASIDDSLNNSLNNLTDERVELEEQENAEKMDNEQAEITQKIVATYGEQWDFCSCIAKNDSIDKAIEGNDLSDADLDFLLARMDKIEEKCKLMTSGSQGTPDERAAHAKKVKDCLK